MALPKLSPPGRVSSIMAKRVLFTLLATGLLLSLASAQNQNENQGQHSQHDMAGMDGSNRGLSDMKDMEGDGGAHAMHSMESRHLDMGPHMKMTALREPKSGDQKRAEQVIETARSVAQKYQDYHVALADGYQIFLPNVPQQQYHFTNNRYAFEAAFRFKPEHPTSLLYEKHGDDYKLIGVMYTARKNMSEDQLDKRIPLSVAQWHQHVNFCAPPADKKNELWGPHARFGLAGSIATKEECEAAGGKFSPVIFGWMVHVYPFEERAEDIWAVDRGHRHNHDD
jgi:hypothetical protein